MMNQDQWMALLRVLLAAGGPVVALLISFGIPADQANTLSSSLLAIAGAAGPIISLVWGIISHSDSGTVAATERLSERTDGAVRLAVLPTAPEAVTAIADDPNRPDVVPVRALPVAAPPIK